MLVNSDESLRQSKDDKEPIQNEILFSENASCVQQILLFLSFLQL